MKKKVVIFLGIVSLLIGLGQNVVSAAQAEPDGFRSIKWGAKISDLKDMILLPYIVDKKETAYRKTGDELKIGNAQVESIEYVFYKDKLYMVRINFRKEDNFKSLKKSLEEQFGAGKKPNVNFEQYVWDWKNAGANIVYYEKSDQGHIVYHYKPIYKEKVIDREKELEREKMERAVSH